MSAPKKPFTIRWRDGVMDDPNPVLTWKALAAAMPLVRHADVRTGHNCYPGAASCAREMRVSKKTIERGWAELVEAGWLELRPLPASRRRSQGALKVLRFPKALDIPPDSPQVATYPLTVHELPPDSPPTIPGNQEPSGPEGPPGAGEPCVECGEHRALSSSLLCRGCWYAVGADVMGQWVEASSAERS